MHSQDAAVGLRQPTQHDDFVTDCNAIQARPDLRVQDKVGVWCAFVTLTRRVGRRSQRASDVSDGAQREVVGGRVGHGSYRGDTGAGCRSSSRHRTGMAGRSVMSVLNGISSNSELTENRASRVAMAMTASVIAK